MDRRSSAVLAKMLQHTISIMSYCEDCQSREQFEANPMRVEATGELAKEALDDETKTKIKTILGSKSTVSATASSTAIPGSVCKSSGTRCIMTFRCSMMRLPLSSRVRVDPQLDPL